MEVEKTDEVSLLFSGLEKTIFASLLHAHTELRLFPGQLNYYKNYVFA